MALPQLKLLINLARIDGEVADREQKYISNIGLANGIPIGDITPLFNTNHEIIVPSGLNADQRFEYIFSLVQLMKIDERLYQDEIRFCSKVASKLGYDQSVMFELMLHVRSVMEANELESLKQLTAKYLNTR
ncbi:MAG TPA: TerB family tellurite resistance protein [Cyclobacteriaceae bacterium]